MTPDKDELYNYLQQYCQGRNRAIKFKDLGEKIALEPVDWRIVAKLIEGLRLSGKPIATGRFGAFIPATEDEKKACLRTIYRRALGTLRTVRALEEAFGRQVVQQVNQEFNQLPGGQFELTICKNAR